MANIYNRRAKKGMKRDLRALIQRIDSAFFREYPGQQRSSLRREHRKFRRKIAAYERLMLREEALDPHKKYIQEFSDKKAFLEALGYLENDELTTAGLLDSQIHGNELLITEMFMEGLFQAYTPPELNAALVSVTSPEGQFHQHRLIFADHHIWHSLMKWSKRWLGIRLQFNDHGCLISAGAMVKASPSLEDSSVDGGD